MSAKNKTWLITVDRHASALVEAESIPDAISRAREQFEAYPPTSDLRYEHVECVRLWLTPSSNEARCEILTS